MIPPQATSKFPSPRRTLGRELDLNYTISLATMINAGLYLALLALTLISWVVRKWRNPPCNGTLPPGSMGLPLIGESIQFIMPSRSLDIPHFVKSRIHKYGPIFRTSLAGRPVVVSSDPEFNHYILQQEGKLVELWYLDAFAKLLGQNGSKGEGSTTATGYVHKYLRNLVLAHFGPESLKDRLLPKLEEMATQGLRAYVSHDCFDIKRACSAMIIEATAKEMLGYDPQKSEEKLSENFANFLNGLMSFPVNIPGTAFHRCLQNQKKTIRMIKGMIEERRAFPETRRGDLLDQVVEDMKKESFLREDFIAVVVFGLLLASFETISATITLAIKLLTENPRALEELEAENEAVVRNRDPEQTGLTWKEYKSMTFTHQVVNELLRMASVAPGILRKVIKDVHVGAYTIPAGWTILVVPAALQLNPDTYKDPLAFNPWRWKETGGNIATAKNFIPFGGGSRACAGAEFSKALMGTFLHVMITNYRWTKVRGGDVSRSPVLGFGDGYFIKLFPKHSATNNY